MKSHAFSIGGEFTCGGCKWRCTDIGSRAIVAMALDRDDEPSWTNGPPYAVAECVFDEYDREGCKRVEAAASK